MDAEGARVAPWTGRMSASPRGRRVVLLGPQARLVDLVEERVLWTHGREAWRAAIGPDGAVALAGPEGISIVDADGAVLRSLLATPQSMARALAWRSDGRELAAAVGDAIVRIDPATGEVRTDPAVHGAEVMSVVVADDGAFAVTGDRDGVRIAWHGDGRAVIVEPPVPPPAEVEPGPRFFENFPSAAALVLAVSADGARAASSHEGGYAHLFDPRTGAGILTLATDVADRDQLLEADHVVQLEVPDTRAEEYSCGTGEPRWTAIPAFSRDGRRLAVHGSSRLPEFRSAVRVYRVEDGHPEATYVFDETVSQLGFQVDGTLLVQAGSELVALGSGPPRFVAHDVVSVGLDPRTDRVVDQKPTGLYALGPGGEADRLEGTFAGWTTVGPVGRERAGPSFGRHHRGLALSYDGRTRLAMCAGTGRLIGVDEADPCPGAATSP